MAADNEKSKQEFVFEMKYLLWGKNGFENLVDYFFFISESQKHSSMQLSLSDPNAKIHKINNYDKRCDQFSYRSN